MPSPEPPPSPSPLFRASRPFLLALGFLTRLGPSFDASRAEMAASVSFYPLAGVVLGAVLCLPVWLGLFSVEPWIQAWIYVLMAAWITRALHLDGVADLCDAFGSGKTGDEFRRVLKDSRTGAFGVAGIVLVVSGHIILVAANLQSGALGALFFAPVLGRCMPLALALTTPAYPSPGLGALVAESSKTAAISLATACVLIGGFVCLGPWSLFLALILAGSVITCLSRLARRENGYNGDFFGCAILSGELAVLLAALG